MLDVASADPSVYTAVLRSSARGHSGQLFKVLEMKSVRALFLWRSEAQPSEARARHNYTSGDADEVLKKAGGIRVMNIERRADKPGELRGAG